MTTIKINDTEAHAFWIEVPSRGAWIAHMRIDDLEAKLKLNDEVTIKLDDLEMKGTIIRDHLDSAERALDVVGGKAGWRKIVPAKSYASDSGIEAKIVADDLAADAEETIDTFDVVSTSLGPSYVRLRGRAGPSLEDVIGGAYWWVDFDGVTHVAIERPSETRTEDDFAVSSYDPNKQLVILDVEDLRKFKPGDKLKHDFLDAEKTIERMVIRVNEDQPLVIEAQCSDHNDFAMQLEAAIKRVVEQQAVTLLEYTIDGQTDDHRLKLKPVDEDLPTLDKVEVWAGLPGMTHDELSGMRVLVGFIGGKRARPVVLAFAPPNGPNWEPPKITLNTNIQITGTVEIDGAVTTHDTVEIDGAVTTHDDISADGEVAASASSPSTQVTMTGHIHSTGTGPSAPATVPEP